MARVVAWVLACVLAGGVGASAGAARAREGRGALRSRAALPGKQAWILWGEGRGAGADRALERWYRAVERGEVPPLRLGAGFPRIMPGTRAAEWVVLGRCPVAVARARARLLQRRFPEVRTVPASATSDDLPPGACPSLPAVEAPTFDVLLAEVDPTAARGAVAAREKVAVCSFGREELRRQHGRHALCRGLWGARCDDFEAAMGFAPPGAGSDCSFLAGLGARRVVAVETDQLELLACATPAEGDITYVLVRPAQDPIPTLTDAICAQGADYATTLGRVRLLGGAVCIDYERARAEGGRRRVELGVRCYGLAGGGEEVVVDDVVIGEHAAPRAVAAIAGEVLCVDPGEGGDPYALRLGAAGFEPVRPVPAACAKAEYDAPRVR